MELCRGITGFRHVDDPPLPTCDLRAFRGHCHAAARALGGQVVAADMPVNRSGANFARTTLELLAGPVAVLLNLYHPVIAFVEPTVENDLPLRFIDAPALAQQLREIGAYEILSAAEARKPIGEEHCRLLSDAELEQLRYWRPWCIGAVVFNHWD